MIYSVFIYGLNFGFVGFLMNEFWIDGLRECLVKVEVIMIYFLFMWVVIIDGVEV